jgi:hypothetical protein
MDKEPEELIQINDTALQCCRRWYGSVSSVPFPGWPMSESDSDLPRNAMWP